MKAIWITTTSMNLETITNSYPGEVYQFDRVLPSWDLAMVDKIRNAKPDVAFFVGTAEGRWKVSALPLKIISETCPIINICCDASDPKWWPVLAEYHDKKCIEFTVNLDGNETWLKYDRDMTMWCPNSSTPYNAIRGVTPKDIKLGFQGGCGSRERRDMIGALGGYVTIGERNETQNSYHEYVSFMLRCKSVLNMPFGGSGNIQMKNRVLEVGLARSCLFELKGSPTKKWFEPGVDYVEYETSSDIKDMLDNPRFDWEAYARNLSNKVNANYTSELFWKKVLGSL